MVQPREFFGEEVHRALSVLADIGGGKVDSHRSGQLTCGVIAYEANSKISKETEVAERVRSQHRRTTL